MKTKCFDTYTFDELDERAKERARDWYRDGGIDNEMAWEQVQEDAKEVGLKIFSVDPHRNNEGEFITCAHDCASKIVETHGDTCETYKTAKRYLETMPTGDDDEALIDWSHEFLHDILEDYRIMLDQNIEYFYSAESVDESIRANDYVFTVDGSRRVTL